MEQPPPELAVERTTRFWVMPLFVPLSLLGGLFPSFSLTANLYVLLLGSVLMMAGLSARLPRRPAPASLASGIVWWLLPLAAFVAVELTSFLMGSTYNYPTFSLLLDPLLDGYLMRSLVYFGWLSVFWAMVRR
jgi:hypothetical protein